MIMNTQQLFYLTEIERTRSISQAAENLYMSQPNLSRILRELEGGLGFAIFQRTRRGVQPTEKGALFLQHAKNILREAEFMERLGPNHSPASRFRICLPRSWTFLELTQRYISTLSPEAALDARIRECHPRQALELLGSCEAEIAVIRYAVEYQPYFEEQCSSKKLRLTPLDQVEYSLVLSRDDPLAWNTTISRKALENYTELLHRDVFHPGMKGRRSLTTVDRLAQLQLLRTLPQSFTWSEPLPPLLLQTAALVQLPCQEGGQLYRNALVCNPQCAMSEMEQDFSQWLRMVSAQTIP